MTKIHCTVRQASSNVDAKHYDTERLRKEYLVQNIMVPGEINMVYSMFDRIIAGAPSLSTRNSSSRPRRS